MNNNLHSEFLQQDVLILTGAEDHFIPLKMHYRQIKSLRNAKSVTARIYTKKDQAQNHSQIGFMGPALPIILKGIERKS